MSYQQGAVQNFKMKLPIISFENVTEFEYM